MPLSVGAKLGPYEILAPIGKGGMGEVYKARDTRLDRVVAIKTSKEQFSERFEREARAVAALNHPHICTLYDVGPDYLVMEYIDGQPLKGPMPIKQASRLAVQILDALAAAHRMGIVHRDLKPGNVLVTKAGVKLLDFGLAKYEEKPAAATGEETITLHLTASHTIIGTPQYMAPEQVEGRQVDCRADIFAFGCVFYELLTGRKAFEGKTPSAVLASVLAAEPPAISAVTPVLERVVKACLAKDADERLQSARDVRHAIEWALAEPINAAELASRRTQWLPWAATAVLVLALAAMWLLRSRPEERLIQFEILPPEGTSFGQTQADRYAISPDGRRLAFTAVDARGKRNLWVRSLDSPQSARLPGTEGATAPFWNPDSRWLGFSASGKLQKIDVTGGVPQALCEITGIAQGTWNRNGDILVSGAERIIRRLSASGGTSNPVLPPDKSRAEPLQTSPVWLPDGRHFLYHSHGSKRGIVVGSLDGRSRLLFDVTVAPVMYSPARGRSGYLLFLRGSQLMAQPFNPDKAELSGEAVPVAEPIQGDFSVSESNVLVFRRGHDPQRQLTWYQRDGKRLGNAGEPFDIHYPRISPDQKTVAFSRDEGMNIPEIWTMDLERGTATRLSLGADYTNYPVWPPDGTRVLYYTRRGDERLIVERPLSGIDKENIVYRLAANLRPTSWSRDGRWLVLSRPGESLLLPLSTGRPEMDPKPIAFGDIGYVYISPDGRWMLFSSNKTGKEEVFVQSLPLAAGGPSNGGKWQISTTGGANPAWRADGKEIFYLASDGKMMSVLLESDANRLKPLVPTPLFETRLGFGGNLREYDVTADGKRFLLAQAAGDEKPQPITVTLNWPALLNK